MNDWATLEKMLEDWILKNTTTFELRQSLIPIRDFIFDRTTDGKPYAPKKSRKQRIEEELRASDLTAQETGRSDIEYGHHDSLPRGEHVARMKK